MYGIYAYIDPQNHPNVGIYGMHGVSGSGMHYWSPLEDVNLAVPNLAERCEVMQFYAELTGDWDGVDVNDGVVTAKCWEGKFWHLGMTRFGSRSGSKSDPSRQDGC